MPPKVSITHAKISIFFLNPKQVSAVVASSIISTQLSTEWFMPPSQGSTKLPISTFLLLLFFFKFHVFFKINALGLSVNPYSALTFIGFDFLPNVGK